MTVLHTNLRPGDTLVIGNGTRIRLEAKSGKVAQIVVESDEIVSKESCAEQQGKESDVFRFRTLEDSYRIG